MSLAGIWWQNGKRRLSSSSVSLTLPIYDREQADKRVSKLLQGIIPQAVLQHLDDASAFTSAGQDAVRSSLRISNLYLPEIGSSASSSVNAGLYYIHSAISTDANAVFFGPDTYLFLDFLRTTAALRPGAPKSIIDVCCGAGAGIIHMARIYPQAQSFGLDLNPEALRLARINAELAGVNVDFRPSDLFAAAPEDLKLTGFDVIVANPPYIASSTSGSALPTYADGGDVYGLGLSFRIVEDGVKLLSVGGHLIIYTGVAVEKAQPGRDIFLERLQGLSNAHLVEYKILHPDMWSEEIGNGAYVDVGRVQAVGAVLCKAKE
jgi:methylase of polypeptide subunit release factors